MATIKKNQTAEIPTKGGSKYSYQYVDIAQIHEYLEENNMSYYQYIERIDNDDYIMTVRIIDGKEQPALRGSRVVDATLYGNDNPAQKQGSALTYARRYSLLMAFGLATEDDDAQSLNIAKITTKEEAEKYVLNFGKYSGKTLKEIVEKDKRYIDWLFESEKTNQVIKDCITLITGKVEVSDEEFQEQMKKMNTLNELLEATNTDREKFYEYYKVSTNADMTMEQLEDAIAKLRKKLSEI